MAISLQEFSVPYLNQWRVALAPVVKEVAAGYISGHCSVLCADKERTFPKRPHLNANVGQPFCMISLNVRYFGICILRNQLLMLCRYATTHWCSGYRHDNPLIAVCRGQAVTRTNINLRVSFADFIRWKRGWEVCLCVRPSVLKIRHWMLLTKFAEI
jgi:hypothetical protein